MAQIRSNNHNRLEFTTRTLYSTPALNLFFLQYSFNGHVLAKDSNAKIFKKFNTPIFLKHKNELDETNSYIITSTYGQLDIVTDGTMLGSNTKPTPLSSPLDVIA
jgi:hypothetical protein